MASGRGDLEQGELLARVSEAEALAKPDIVALFQQNLEEEQHTLDEIRRAIQDITRQTVQQGH